MEVMKLKLTVSHNEVNERFAVMGEPSVLLLELNPEKTKLWNELRNINPNIIYHWGQQIWDKLYPKVYGKVIKVEVL